MGSISLESRVVADCHAGVGRGQGSKGQAALVVLSQTHTCDVPETAWFEPGPVLHDLEYGPSNPPSD